MFEMSLIEEIFFFNMSFALIKNLLKNLFQVILDYCLKTNSIISILFFFLFRLQMGIYFWNLSALCTNMLMISL